MKRHIDGCLGVTELAGVDFGDDEDVLARDTVAVSCLVDLPRYADPPVSISGNPVLIQNERDQDAAGDDQPLPEHAHLALFRYRAAFP